MAPLSQPPPDLETLARAVRNADDYWRIIRTYLPMWFIGGGMGVIMHQRQITAALGWTGKVILFVSEWTMGGAGAVLLALLYPTLWKLFPDVTPRDLEAEIAICGLIGGSASRAIFNCVTRRLFRIDSNAGGYAVNGEWQDHQKPQGGGGM